MSGSGRNGAMLNQIVKDFSFGSVMYARRIAGSTCSTGPDSYALSTAQRCPSGSSKELTPALLIHCGRFGVEDDERPIAQESAHADGGAVAAGEEPAPVGQERREFAATLDGGGDADDRSPVVVRHLAQVAQVDDERLVAHRPPTAR